MVLLERYHFGLRKTSLNSEVVLILGGLNSDILLYTVSCGMKLK